ncbi:MAG: hypothetical protein IJZ44_02090 [Lachnospiraceae bacterium]|nr:hypothetical protein [Lachnospiraceae bacterium]
MPNKDELLQSITPGMKLDKAFFLKVYGYEISYPGFSETAIKALEDAGCSKARSYYERITAEYEAEQAAKLKPVAAWLRKEIDEEYERKVRKYQEKEGEEPRNDLQKMSNWELLKLLKSSINGG